VDIINNSVRKFQTATKKNRRPIIGWEDNIVTDLKKKGLKVCKVFASFCKEPNVGFCKMAVRKLVLQMSQFP
jgi:hypothetical protein